MVAVRSISSVLRDMQLIKSQVSDPAVRSALLAPLEAELHAFAEAAKKQLELPLPPSSSKPKA